jgi:hypothetical protein
VENPFRDDGPVDKTMSFVALGVSLTLFLSGLAMYRRGASPLWPLAGGIVVALNCRAAYRRLRSWRRRG